MEVVEVVAGRPVIELAKLCYAAGRPLLLEGRHGVGKSELLERAARRSGDAKVIGVAERILAEERAAAATLAGHWDRTAAL